MDYGNNYGQIGAYGLSMPYPQLFYPEMGGGGGKGYVEGSAMDIMNPRYDSYYKDDNKGSRHTVCDGGDYKHEPNIQPIDLNHFYDGGDRCGSRNYNSQNYLPNSSSGYRNYARQNRISKNMLARNGLYTPRDYSGRQNDYSRYGDDMGHSGHINSYWQ